MRQSRSDADGTRQWLWDPTTKVPLLLSDGIDTYVYGPGLTPVAQVTSSGAIQYLHGDNVGSVRLVTNSSGAVAGAAEYTPYGGSTSTGTSSNFGYADSWTDPVTGLDYLRAREYDPATGQFLEVDPAVDATRQPYAYVANDPGGATDPTGLCGTIENDHTPGCDNIFGAYEKAVHSEMLSGPALWFGDVLQHGATGAVVTVFEGIGDGASFGLTGLIRNAISPGSECFVQKNGFYYSGVGTGAVATTVVSGGASLGSIANAGRLFRAADELGQGAAAEGGVALATDSASSLADEVANATGGVIKTNKGGFTVNIPNGGRGVTIRVMDQGGSRTNYYRISVPGKGTYTSGGEASTDAALTHINIGESSLDDILAIIGRIKGEG